MLTGSDAPIPLAMDAAPPRRRPAAASMNRFTKNRTCPAVPYRGP